MGEEGPTSAIPVIGSSLDPDFAGRKSSSAVLHTDNNASPIFASNSLDRDWDADMNDSFYLGARKWAWLLVLFFVAYVAVFAISKNDQ